MSALAAWQARSAKIAAQNASVLAKARAIMLELGDVSQDIQHITPQSSYMEARDVVTKSSSKIRRYAAAVNAVGSEKIKTDYMKLSDIFEQCHLVLEKARPDNNMDLNTPDPSVFTAIEVHTKEIIGVLADMVGDIDVIDLKWNSNGK